MSTGNETGIHRRAERWHRGEVGGSRGTAQRPCDGSEAASGVPAIWGPFTYIPWGVFFFFLEKYLSVNLKNQEIVLKNPDIRCLVKTSGDPAPSPLVASDRTLWVPSLPPSKKGDASGTGRTEKNLPQILLEPDQDFKPHHGLPFILPKGRETSEGKSEPLPRPGTWIWGSPGRPVPAGALYSASGPHPRSRNAEPAACQAPTRVCRGRDCPQPPPPQARGRLSFSFHFLPISVHTSLFNELYFS